MKKIKIIKDTNGYKSGEVYEVINEWEKPLIQESVAESIFIAGFGQWVDEPEEVKFNGGPFPIQLPEKIEGIQIREGVTQLGGAEAKINEIIDYLKAHEALTDKK